MNINIKMIIMSVFLFGGSFSSSWAVDSLTFGGPGHITSSKVHVYRDKSNPVIQCKDAKCFSFSFLVDEMMTLPGAMTFSHVMFWATYDRKIWGEKKKGNAEALSLEGIWRCPDTPEKTRQVVVKVSEKKKIDISKLKFHFLVMKKKCFNPMLDGCNDWEINVEGEFRASELQSLKPINVKDLKKNKC